MTQTELNTVLQSSGIPFVYYAWPKDHCPPLPYGAFLRTRTNNLFADGRVYLKADHYQVELYAALKSPDAEAQLEKALDFAGIAWEITAEDFLEDEHMFEILYEIEV